jgi:hypothetical protein
VFFLHSYSHYLKNFFLKRLYHRNVFDCFMITIKFLKSGLISFCVFHSNMYQSSKYCHILLKIMWNEINCSLEKIEFEEVWSCLFPELRIGVKETNAGIGIPASRILVRYQTKKMPDSVNLVRYQSCSGIISFFQSGTGLTRCQMVRHSGILYIYVHGYWHRHAALTWTCNMDMDM